MRLIRLTAEREAEIRRTNEAARSREYASPYTQRDVDELLAALDAERAARARAIKLLEAWNKGLNITGFGEALAVLRAEEDES